MCVLFYLNFWSFRPTFYDDLLDFGRVAAYRRAEKYTRSVSTAFLRGLRATASKVEILAGLTEKNEGKALAKYIRRDFAAFLSAKALQMYRFLRGISSRRKIY